MAFGDTIEDILLYQKFYTGEHLAASEQQLGTPLFVWQQFDQARRAMPPHDAHDAVWARQYEVNLTWVYRLGDKFRVTLFEPRETRHATTDVDPAARAALPLGQAFAQTFTLGLNQLES